MMTYFRTRYGRYEGIDESGYKLNEVFTSPLSHGHILLTTRHRGWVVLDKREYELLRNGQVETDKALYSVLEDLGVILTRRNLKEIAALYCERYSFLYCLQF